MILRLNELQVLRSLLGSTGCGSFEHDESVGNLDFLRLPDETGHGNVGISFIGDKSLLVDVQLCENFSSACTGHNVLGKVYITASCSAVHNKEAYLQEALAQFAHEFLLV